MFDVSVLDHIGNTPLLPLRRLTGPDMATVLIKMESWNPSGSLKDRIVAAIVDQAETDGRLQPHHIITDASSGNTGIALAMVAALKGYRARIFMPETKSVERRKIMAMWGTEVVLTSGADQNSHIWAVQEAARDTGTYFYLNQNGDEGNVRSHYEGTGKELVAQTDGKIDCFVAGAGTGGTLVGVARCMRDHGIACRMVAVEPADAISKIEGLLHFDGAFVPPIWDESAIDEHVPVTDADAIQTARDLARLEGLFCGPSTGAGVFVALKKAKELGPGKVVVTIACDRGERYLSTKLVPEA